MTRLKGIKGSPTQYKPVLLYLVLHDKHAPLFVEYNRNLTRPVKFATMKNPFKDVTTFQIYSETGWAHLFQGYFQEDAIPFSLYSRDTKWSKNFRVIPTPISFEYTELTESEASVYPLEHQYEEWCRFRTLKLICQE